MHEPSMQGSKFDQNSTLSAVKCGQLRSNVVKQGYWFSFSANLDPIAGSPKITFSKSPKISQPTHFFTFWASLTPLSYIFSVSAQEPLLDRHKNIYTIYSLCPFENTNRAVSFSMLRERVVSFDFSRILELCRRGIFSAYVLLTRFDSGWAK